jgi:membrane protease subunit (stomatin/prohibitin family)
MTKENEIMDMSDAFREVEEQAMKEYQARVASGEDEKEREAFRKRSEAEQARMEAHGCIEKNECPECGESDECKWDHGKCWTCGYCADDDDDDNDDNEGDE